MPISTSRQFDAFLSHNSIDKRLVKEIGRWLADEAGLRVWLDEWNLIPGEPWQEGLEEALDASKCCVVFLGASGIGAWQNEEMRAALAERVDHGDLRVVPVLLPGADRPRKESELPAFLRRLVWVKFVADWKDTALHRLRCGIQGIPPGRRDGGVVVEVCPYRGLQVFRPEDQRFFFGRDALVERLRDHLEGHRFLAVSGPSGSGKSSVVQAGLIPKLDDGETLIEILTPRERPLEELAFALRRCFPEGQAPPTEELVGRLRGSAEALHLIARELADAAGATRVVLVVDQFEELFTQTANDEERRRFVANLLGALERSGPTSVILTMRSDFLGRCALDPDLNVFVNDHLEQIGPMSREELASAITGPARLVGLTFEEGLVEEILDDVKGSPGELPLLQHALLELYERRDGPRLTLPAYQQIGRIEGALTRRAEEEFATWSGYQPLRSTATSVNGHFGQRLRSQLRSAAISVASRSDSRQLGLRSSSYSGSLQIRLTHSEASVADQMRRSSSTARAIGRCCGPIKTPGLSSRARKTPKCRGIVWASCETRTRPASAASARTSSSSTPSSCASAAVRKSIPGCRRTSPVTIACSRSASA